LVLSRLTIGQLAKRVGLRPSALRYYEQQNLLVPVERTAAGYRLYDKDAERILRFVQRAQRLGFSLADIRTLLQSNSLSDRSVLNLAEERFVELERRLTEGLVLRHELQYLLRELQDVREQPTDAANESLFERLLDRICGNPQERDQAHSLLGWLADRTNCILASADAEELLAPLRGRHVHIWQAFGGYQILIVGHDPAVEQALEGLVKLEAECSVHPPLEMQYHKEGYLLATRGEDAFIVARLFLALEGE
jgi:DNA-binding transcriptional MerR regulator